MFKTLILTVLTFACLCKSLAQEFCEYKYDYVWILGAGDNDTITDEFGGCEINFNGEDLAINRHPKLTDNPWQNTSMSSKLGDLIFYSNGCSVYNAADFEMINGDSLNPGEPYNNFCPDDGYTGTQNMISLPDLEVDYIFYMFHIDKYINPTPGAPVVVQSKHAYCTTISFDQEYPLGKVISKNIVLLNDTSMLGSPVSAVKTADGRGWWILTPDRWSNEFHKFRIQNGVFEYIGTQAIGKLTDLFATGGQGKFSPNGKLFAWFHPKNGLFLYDFDRYSGDLSNFRHIEVDLDFFIVGGCEFSPSSRFLYINNNTELYQLDLLSNDIQSSLILVGVYDDFKDPLPTQFFYMERTPDNRIFMNVVNGSRHLHVIQEPNIKGLDCRFEQHAIQLPTYNNLTLPHFPNYRLGAITDSLCQDYLVGVGPDLSNVEDEFYIFPNPASENIQIAGVNGQTINEISISIYDLNGNKVLLSEELNINIESIPTGIFYCNIKTELFIQNVKFVVVR